MNKIMMLVAGAAALMSVATMPAQAAGCLSGAAVGGIAGHVAGHHGLIGAGIGCAIGHHHASQKAHERANYNRY